MFKKFKAIIKAVKSHVVYKDFVFQFFDVDTYDKAITGKKLIPIREDFYETPLLCIHILWTHWYTFRFGMWVSFHSIPEYFRCFFLRDLWWVIKEIAYGCFWVWRLPFVVTYINFVEYGLEFILWWEIQNNKTKYPIKKAKEYYRYLKKIKFLYVQNYIFNKIWTVRHTWKQYRKQSRGPW